MPTPPLSIYYIGGQNGKGPGWSYTQTSEEHCGSSLPVWIQQQSRWWRLFEWRSLHGRPGCQLDATEQPQV